MQTLVRIYPFARNGIDARADHLRQAQPINELFGVSLGLIKVKPSFDKNNFERWINARGQTQQHSALGAKA